MKLSGSLKSILDPIKGQLESVETVIRANLRTGLPDIDESTRQLFESGGKRLRASIVLLTAGLKGAPPENIFELAAATEIIHGASLIHDDIIDHSILRRGIPTVSKRWGNKLSVLAGDYLYTLALHISLKDENTEVFSVMVKGTADMVLGELAQLQYSNIDSINRERYFQIIELKTARFMSCCARLGGFKAGFSKTECDSLADYGGNLGFAFQIVDDTLDLYDENSETGKDIGNDLDDGKITLPFILLIESGSAADRDILKEYIADPSHSLWNKLRARMDDLGVLELALKQAEVYIKNSKKSLEIFPDSEYKKILIELADFFLMRKY
jgi:octaprenyl-diphosphate synthase